MMARGFITDAQLWVGDDEDSISTELHIKDEDQDQVIISGDGSYIINIDFHGKSLSFDYDQAEAFLEAFKEIFDRYERGELEESE